MYILPPAGGPRKSLQKPHLALGSGRWKPGGGRPVATTVEPKILMARVVDPNAAPVKVTKASLKIRPLITVH